MYEIRTAIKNNLLPVGAKWNEVNQSWSLATFPWDNYDSLHIYYDQASKKAKFPYIVFSFENLFSQDESSESFILNIDGWDAPADGNSEPLEYLMSNLDGNGDIKNPTGLNERVIETDKVLLILRREMRYVIPDDDKTIKRRRYTYQVTIFEKEE